MQMADIFGVNPQAISKHLKNETFAQKPSSKKAIKLPTSQSKLQSITSY